VSDIFASFQSPAKRANILCYTHSIIKSWTKNRKTRSTSERISRCKVLTQKILHSD